MILLDTNVVSDAMKSEPNDKVQTCLNDQAAETLHLSSVTRAEVLFGIEAMPAGRRPTVTSQPSQPRRASMSRPATQDPFHAAGVPVINPWEP